MTAHIYKMRLNLKNRLKAVKLISKSTRRYCQLRSSKYEMTLEFGRYSRSKSQNAIFRPILKTHRHISQAL